MDALATFNLVEAAIWALFGVILLGAAARRRPGWRHAVVAGAAFLAFGASDLVEVRTGTWWRPWWLLAWKAGCVVVLAGTYRSWRRFRPGA